MSRGLPKISIIIPVVGYNCLPWALQDSLNKLAYPKKKLELIVVNDDEVKIPPFGIKLKIVIEKHKIGYAEAANLGAKYASTELLFLINPDVKLDKDCLRQFVAYFSSYKMLGVAGPKVYALSHPKQVSAFDLPGIGFNPTLAQIKPVYVNFIDSIKTPYEVNWISGCAMFFSKKVWKKVGGFDEKLFIYWEDADFCMRAREKGYKVMLFPNILVWHEGSVFMGKKKLNKTYYLTRNNRFFINRHSFISGKVILHLHSIVSSMSKILQIFGARDKVGENMAYLMGIVDYYIGKFGINKHSFLTK